MTPSQRTPNRSHNAPNYNRRRIGAVIVAGALALLAYSGIKDNQEYDVAQALGQQSGAVAQDLASGKIDASRVAIVPVEGGQTTTEAARKIMASSSDVEEIANIIGEQEQDGGAVAGGVVALPRADVASSVLDRLPHQGDVTVQGLTELAPKFDDTAANMGGSDPGTQPNGDPY